MPFLWIELLAVNMLAVNKLIDWHLEPIQTGRYTDTELKKAEMIQINMKSVAPGWGKQ